MTEPEWQTAADPMAMLAFLAEKLSDRKRALFAAACWRRTALVRETPACQRAIVVAEHTADGQAAAGWGSTLNDVFRSLALPPGYLPDVVAQFTGTMGWSGFVAYGPALAAQAVTFEHAYPDFAEECGRPSLLRALIEQNTMDERVPILTTARREQAGLVRHLAGNPFHPYPAPTAWPSAVVDLAQALYDGDDNRLILADALEEAGQQPLADHFRQEEWHPKGCWALDLILGRE